MLDNNKLFGTILCINDEEHGEIIGLNLRFIRKPVLTANGNIDYKNITHKYTSPAKGDIDLLKILFIYITLPF